MQVMDTAQVILSVSAAAVSVTESPGTFSEPERDITVVFPLTDTDTSFQPESDSINSVSSDPISAAVSVNRGEEAVSRLFEVLRSRREYSLTPDFVFSIAAERLPADIL